VVALVRLGQASRALNTLNSELEHRVEERTAALSAANTELRASEARKAAILEGSVDGIAALDAHTLMSTQALKSEAVRDGIMDILLNHARLWEALRARAGAGRTGGAEP